MAYVKRDNPNGAGRKGKYTPDMAQRAYRLALLGLTDAQIADALDIPLNTMNYWKQSKPAFDKELKKGKLEADTKVAEALYKRALGYSHRDTVILTNRVNEYDEDGKIIRSYNEPLIVETIKHYPPDTYACNKWLSIRQREYWADVQKVEHSITGSVDLNMIANQISNPDQYTDEELEMAVSLGLKKQLQNVAKSTN